MSQEHHLMVLACAGPAARWYDIRWAVIRHVRHPLSLCQVEDRMFERCTDISRETARSWWNRSVRRSPPGFESGALIARPFLRWRRHGDAAIVRINGGTRDLRRAVDHEGEVVELFATKPRGRKAAPSFLRRATKRYGRPQTIAAIHASSHNHFNLKRTYTAGQISNSTEPLLLPSDVRSGLHEPPLPLPN